MANHIKTVIKFKNLKKQDIDLLLDLLAVPPEDSSYEIDFNKIIPEPEYESECPDMYKVNKDSHIEILESKPWFDWYDWHTVYWGTKWNAFNCYTIIGKTFLTFVFETAWNVALPIIYKLDILGYDIDVAYADENYGNNCGKMKYTKGESGWDEYDEFDGIKNPVQFARNLWNKY